MQTECFHCGEPVPVGLDLTAKIDDQIQAMCCLGCQAVAQQINEFGLTDYYRHRTELPKKPEELIPEDLKNLSIFNNQQIQREFVDRQDGDLLEARLIIEGIACPACTWLIESRLSGLAGLQRVDVNYSTQRCTVNWDEQQLSLSEILTEITKLGYKAFPFNPKQREQVYENERKNQLLRIGIAGLFGMQVMMIAVALYFGESYGIDARYKTFFHWISLLLTLPVLLYSGKPIFTGAYRDIKIMRPGMDIPITLGISVAFMGSLIATVEDVGHVYYDSIVMFIFFVLSGRFFEFSSRKKSIAQLDKMASLLPLYANKIMDDGGIQLTLLDQLSVDDKVLVKPGDIIPIDGVIDEGESSVNESIITGESLPIMKQAGMSVIGGSTNVESPLKIRVQHMGEKTILSNISRLIEKAANSKAHTLLLTDKVVSAFIIFIVSLAIIVGISWYHIDASQWLPITIAVLVVSCPCALSLATPTALSSAASTLIKYGIAIVSNNAIEMLGKANCFIFDKTGTLTEGKLQLDHIHIFSKQYTEAQLISIAQSLEHVSEHPIAKAICQLDSDYASPVATQVKNSPGQGLHGLIDNEDWFIGTRAFIKEKTDLGFTDIEEDDSSLRNIILANKNELVASFYFTDNLRYSSQALINYLKQQGKKVILMSGDHPHVVEQIAKQLGIDEVKAGFKPEDKLEDIARRQAQDDIICMIGDGINDAPAFAQADVAIAMTDASDITKLNADLLLLSHDIDTINTLLQIVHKTNATVRANFAWAIGYNLTALPFAIIGLLAPWMAALGMSLSSLIVVLNATRIATKQYN